METKNYKYVGKPLPAYCPIKTERTLEAARDGVAFPHRWGLVVGEKTDKHGLASYLIADKDKTGKTILEQMLEDDLLFENKRNILREVSDGGYEELRLTEYYLPFISEDATYQLPTVNEYIDCAVNVKTDALIEIRMVADGGDLERYLHIPVKTSWPSVSFMDVLGDLEDDIRDMAKNGANGFSYSRENDYPAWNAAFFDKLGRGTELEFESLHELLRTIVSIRLVKVDNRIVEKDGTEAHT